MFIFNYYTIDNMYYHWRITNLYIKLSEIISEKWRKRVKTDRKLRRPAPALLLQGSFVCSPRQVRGETNDPVQAPGGAGTEATISQIQ